MDLYFTHNSSNDYSLQVTCNSNTLEYCSVLWSPSAVGLIQRLEEIQKSFLKQIKGTPKKYWESLKQLKIYSLQRRRERYCIIYHWKILENRVPNINDAFKSKDHPRLGRMCISKYTGIPNYETAH